MSTLDTSLLTPMQLGRLNKALDKQYHTANGIETMREMVARLAPVKKETDGMIDYSRHRFNQMNGDEQRRYMARLEAKRYYWLDNVAVPKIVWDCVVA
jgi:hypothetical protein